MKKIISTFFAAALFANGSFGDYRVDTSMVQFNFEDDHTGDNAYMTVGDESLFPGLIHDLVSIDRISGSETLSAGLTATYRATLKADAEYPEGTIMVKGWGLSQDNQISNCTWIYNLSADYQCAYNSKYDVADVVNDVYLFVHLQWIRYNLRLYDCSEEVRSDSNVRYTDTVALPARSREGYSFDGWTNAYATAGLNDSVTGKDVGAMAADTNIVLGAKWTANKYAIAFDVNASGIAAPAAKTVEYDSAYGELPALSRDGYIFDGWYTAVRGGAKVEAATIVKITSAQTLYARWRALQFAVTLDATPGTVGGETRKSFDVVCGSSRHQSGPSMYATVCNGRTLKGWYDARGGGNLVFDAAGRAVGGDYWSGNYVPGSSDAKWKCTRDVIAYAVWDSNAYTVTLDANGGAITTSEGETNKWDITVNYGELFDQTIPAATKAGGFAIKGWYDAQAGGNLVFDADGKPGAIGTYWDSDSNWIYYGDLMAYAQWTSPYSKAADCDNLEWMSTNTVPWFVDDKDGYMSSSSVCATNDAVVYAVVSNRGTLTFWTKITKVGGLDCRLQPLLMPSNIPLSPNITTTEGVWKCIVCNKKNEDEEREFWLHFSAPKNNTSNECWIDQVHWYPNKFVEKDVSGDWTPSADAENEIKEQVFLNWERLFEGHSISTVKVMFDNSISVDVTEAVQRITGVISDKLKIKYPTEGVDAGKAVLSFVE